MLDSLIYSILTNWTTACTHFQKVSSSLIGLLINVNPEITSIKMLLDVSVWQKKDTTNIPETRHAH